MFNFSDIYDKDSIEKQKLNILDNIIFCNNDNIISPSNINYLDYVKIIQSNTDNIIKILVNNNIYKIYIGFIIFYIDKILYNKTFIRKSYKFGHFNYKIKNSVYSDILLKYTHEYIYCLKREIFHSCMKNNNIKIINNIIYIYYNYKLLHIIKINIFNKNLLNNKSCIKYIFNKKFIYYYIQEICNYRYKFTYLDYYKSFFNNKILFLL